MTECDRAGKWVGGCRFEPRYDEPVLSEMEKMTGREGYVRLGDGDKFVWQNQSLGQRTYVHDICIRCGKIVRRAA